MQDWSKSWQKRTVDKKFFNGWEIKVPRINFSGPKKLRLMKALVIATLSMVLLGSVGFTALFVYFAKDLPRPDKVVRRDGFSSKIVDRKGETLYEIYKDQQRTPVTFEEIPKTLRNATIAIEDKSFYTHGGFDPKSWLRIVWLVITKGRATGGSTLTQQLVKNVLLSGERTLTRKLKEFILAVQIESKYSKDEILQMYLNEAPYGGPTAGVGAGAAMYFGKKVSELNDLEAAILAGLPQNPTKFSTLTGNKEAFKARTTDVLRRMREDNYIDKAMEASLSAALVQFELKPALTSIRAPHFVMYVKNQLEDMLGPAALNEGGLTVTTTLDLGLQSEAQTIVTEEIAKVKDQGIGNGGAVVVDPQNGEILSMVGSKDYFAKDYDGQVNVTLSKRQPGSAIKPLTYALAFERGYTPASMIMDVPTKFPGVDKDKPYEPQNYNGKFNGPTQLRFALGSSLNIPAVKLLAMVGVKELLSKAYSMGISTLEPTDANLKRFGLALTLGGGEVRLLELTTAYSAFANTGYRVDPVSILKITDKNNRVLYENKPQTKTQVFDPAVSFLISHVLSDNNARLLTFGSNSLLNLGGRPISVKTGTTNDKRDNWTIGWGSSGVVGVWVGNNDNSAMKSVTSGVSGASPIWRRVMLRLIKDRPAKDLVIPSNVEARMVDTISGYPEHDGFAVRAEYVMKGTLPPLPDPVHRKILVCKGQDKLATTLDIESGNTDQKEYITPVEERKLGDLPSWQDQITDWIKSGKADARYFAPTEYCGSNDDFVVRLDSPGDKQNFSGKDVNFKIRMMTPGEIDKVEIYVDNSKIPTVIVEAPYETTVSLEKGKHLVKARVWRKDGKSKDTDEVRIGVDGIKWDEGVVYPSPSPSISPTPAP